MNIQSFTHIYFLDIVEEILTRVIRRTANPIYRMPKKYMCETPYIHFCLVDDEV